MLNVANDKNLGVLAVGFIGSPYYAGLYRAARAIVKIIRRIMDPVLEIIFPELVKLYSEKNFELYKRIIFDSFPLINLLIFSRCLVITRTLRKSPSQTTSGFSQIHANRTEVDIAIIAAKDEYLNITATNIHTCLLYTSDAADE